MTGRSVPEWIGKTPDSAIPRRVRARVFVAHGGVCHRTGCKIIPGDAWDVDHILALTLGGENRESNLAPILREAHKAKTAEDVGMKAKADRLRAKHLGIKQPNPRGIKQWRAFDGSPRARAVRSTP